MTLGQRIRENRKGKEFTQEYLAEQLGVSRQAVSKWEKDLSLPTMENLLELCRLLGISLSALTGTEEDASGESPDGRLPQSPRNPNRTRLLWAGAAVLAVCCLFFLWGRQESSPGYYRVKERMLAEGLTQLPDGRSVWLRLVLVEGVYFDETWEEYLPGGGVYPENYQGSYELRVEDTGEQLLSSRSLSEDFGGELNFSGVFELSTFDYNWDGLPEVALGQWGSSSGFLYCLYTLEADGSLRRSCPELIFDTDTAFCKTFAWDKAELGRGFHASVYNNAVGEVRTVRYLWNGDSFLPEE